MPSSVLDAHVDPDRVIAVLSEAMCEQPDWRAFSPDRATRIRWLRRILAPLVRYGARHGEILSAGDGAAAAIVLPPGGFPLSTWGLLRSGVIGAMVSLPRPIRRQRTATHRHARRTHEALLPGPHYWLHQLGVHPRARGAGLARALVGAAARRADAAALPIYATTYLPSNVDFFHHLSFETAAHVPARSDGALAHWALIRRPRPDAGA